MAREKPVCLERVHDLRAKGCGVRIGMGCKAQTTDIALAMARICNAADRPRPRLHTREEIVNTFLSQHLLHAQVGQGIGPLIAWVARMAFDPMPGNAVARVLHQGIQSPP